jgi:hypothetical protein
MSDTCKIGRNTGFPDCISMLGSVIGFGKQDLYDSAGQSNSLTFDPDVLEWTTAFGMLQFNADLSKRVYPVTGLLNVKPTREENQYDTASNGYKVKLRDGVTSYDFEHWNSSNVFYKKLIGECSCASQTGLYLFTKEGIIVYKQGETFYPVPLSLFDAYFMPKSDANVAKTMISMQIDPSIDISDLWLIEWSDLGTTLRDQKGFIDVEFDGYAILNGNNITVSFSASTSYNKNKKKSNVLGLTPAQLVYKRVDTGATLTPTVSSFNTLTGKYSATIPTASGLTAGSYISVEIAYQRYEGKQLFLVGQ